MKRQTSSYFGVASERATIRSALFALAINGPPWGGVEPDLLHLLASALPRQMTCRRHTYTSPL